MVPLAVSLLVVACPMVVQGGSDIYLVNVERFAGGMRLGPPENITSRPGYDNQPAFLPDGSGILYTSIRDDGQADTYRYDLGTRRTTRLTETAESEYSPSVMPDGRRVSVVRVERDSVQRLWAFGLPDGAFEVLFPDLAPVGYYAWLDSTTAAVFVLGDPPTLQLTRPEETPTVVARDIGRTIARVPGSSSMSFVQRRGSDTLWIASRRIDRDSITMMAQIPGAEYFAWTPDGALLAARNQTILLCHPGSSPIWTEVADFSPMGLGPISRIAVSPQGDWLAFVAAEP